MLCLGLAGETFTSKCFLAKLIFEANFYSKVLAQGFRAGFLMFEGNAYIFRFVITRGIKLCLGPAKEHLHSSIYMQSFSWNFRYTKIHLYSRNG